MLADDEISHCLEDIINENCVLTLSQINEELRRRPLPILWFMTRRLIEVWKECCSVFNWFSPSQQTETDVMFYKKSKNMETRS